MAAAVEVIRRVVGRQFIGLAAQSKASLADTVAVASDRRAKPEPGDGMRFGPELARDLDQAQAPSCHAIVAALELATGFSRCASTSR